MDEVLVFLDTITPTWAVSLTAFLVVTLHSWLLWRSTKVYIVKCLKKPNLKSLNCILQHGAEHLSILLIHAVFAGLYFIFWVHSTPIEVRGPLVRFAMEALFVLQFSRGAYALIFKQLKQGNHDD